jgi:flagellar basal body-associated protein FliL
MKLFDKLSALFKSKTPIKNISNYEQNPKKSKKKLIILIVFFMIILIGFLIGIFFFKEKLIDFIETLF